jgi:hypothetical protein
VKENNLSRLHKAIFLSAVLFFLFSCFLISQEKEKKILEKVEVTEVEVPVRVIYKNNLVDGLNRSDFKLYENGILQKINGFFIERKKISLKSSNVAGIETRGKGSDPRFFVLVFKITDYNEQLKKGIKYLFDNILRKNDQLMIFINDKTLFINDLKNKGDSLKFISKIVMDESIKAKQRLINILDIINNEFTMSEMDRIMRSQYASPARSVTKLLEKYLEIWEHYKKRYLTPDLDNYYNFANHLQKINKEKWVINFYQMEMFPKFKSSGEFIRMVNGLIGQLQMSDRGEDVMYARSMSSLLNKIDIALNVSSDFPSDEISKLFYKVDVIFHSIFFQTTKTTLHQDLEYKRVSTNIENNLRELTRKTGGAMISSENIASSLEKITEKEDILYILTYTPVESRKIGKIKIITNYPGYRVVYDNNIRADYITEYVKKKESAVPQVKIREAVFKNGVLIIRVVDYFFRMESGKKLGKLKIRVQVVSGNGKIHFDQNKIIVADKSHFKISLDFKKLNPGSYNIIIDVLDLLTTKSDMKLIQPEAK